MQSLNGHCAIFVLLLEITKVLGVLQSVYKNYNNCHSGVMKCFIGKSLLYNSYYQINHKSFLTEIIKSHA